MSHLVRALSALVRILPEFVLRAICWGLGMILYGIKSKRRVVLSNLAHVYPDLTPPTLRRLARKNCALTIEMGLFALASPGFGPGTIRKKLTLGEGFAESYHRVAGQSPMLVLLPHNYLNEMVIFAPEMLGLPRGKVAAIFRPMDNAKLDQWIKETRERGGLKLISRHRGLETAIAHLRDNGHLAILADQSAGDSGVLGRVAGRTASLSPFPDLLVKKFPVQLAFAYIERRAFFRGTLRMEVPPDREREPSVLFADWLSSQLLHEPGWQTNWLWMHRRWKTQRQPARRLRLEMKRGINAEFFNEHDDRRRADRFYIRLPNWLGDIVMALPLIRAIRRGRPDVRLTLVYRPHFEPLIRLLDFPVDDHLPVDSRTREGRRILRARRRDFPDTAILLTNSFRGDREMQLIGAEQRFGIGRPGKPRPLLTHRWDRPANIDESLIHQTDLWTRFLRHFGLIEEPDFQPVARPDKLGQPNRIALFCGSENSPEKRWSPENWIRLICDLLSRDETHRIELFGTSADRAVTDRIERDINHPHVTNLAGKTNLAELGERIRHCELAIGNDSGGMHLANALGCPGVVLFGPTNPVRTRPIFEAPLEMVLSSDSGQTGGGTMAAISPEAVLEAVRRISSAVP